MLQRQIRVDARSPARPISAARHPRPRTPPLLGLASTIGNRALTRLVARWPKTEHWYRGEAPGVARASPGGSVHDLGDGLYFTDDPAVAQSYGDLRAGNVGGGTTLGAEIDPRLLGKVLDLTADARWAAFMAEKPPLPMMGESWGEYMSRGSELFNSGFRLFLARNNIRLADYDAVIGPDLIRNPHAKQLVVRNDAIAEKLDDLLQRVEPASARTLPTRGGPGGGGPSFELEGGRVKLYRAIGPDEASSLLRHADFEYAPSGSGKYFTFSEADARVAARALYGDNVTIVETMVPRGFVPAQPGTEAVQQPHIGARGGATMIEGEVSVFYDPRAGGWSLHVDDNALDALNAQMTRPRIISSPVASIGAAPAASPPVADVAPPRAIVDVAPPGVAGESGVPAVRAVEPPEAGPRIRPEGGGGFIKGGAFFVGQLVLFWWLGKKAAEEERENVTRLTATKIEPEVSKRLQAEAATAERLTANNPAFPVYANVTVDYDAEWTESGIGRNPSEEHVRDMRFVSLQVTQLNVEEERQLSHDKDTSWLTSVETHYVTRRRTYSFEIPFDETPEEHHARVVLHDAGAVAAQGISARRIGERIEATHWPATRGGQADLRRARRDREEWVRAYIHYAFSHGLRAQYDDAARYLQELETRAAFGE